MVLQTGAFLGTTKKIFVGISTECLPVFWGTSPDTPGHLNVKETSLEQVIKELEKQTGLQFFYSQDKSKRLPVYRYKLNKKILKRFWTGC